MQSATAARATTSSGCYRYRPVEHNTHVRVAIPRSAVSMNIYVGHVDCPNAGTTRCLSVSAWLLRCLLCRWPAPLPACLRTCLGACLCHPGSTSVLVSTSECCLPARITYSAMRSYACLILSSFTLRPKSPILLLLGTSCGSDACLFLDLENSSARFPGRAFDARARVRTIV
eukprot:SAG11_NODE_2413_length_3392_cov_2.367750_1_plen_172_part_00